MSMDNLVATVGLPQAAEISPVFAHQRGGRLDLLAQGEHLTAGLPACETTDAWRYVTALVARDPLDLEAQARRVVMACQPDLRDRLFGALIDVFLALGNRGRGLRAALLHKARAYLELDELRFLEHHLEPGLSPLAQLPAQAGSVHDRGVLGSVHMVTHQRVAARELNAHEEAMARIDEGDLDGARHLLEKALLEAPDQVDVMRELQDIYRYTRDDTAKAAMLERLRERHGAAPAGWQ
ncbi:MAG: hypothetical protein IPG93_07935 [Burkholderiales bacterium]|nr:hypothetical protein [Burkholderiales bacterium]